MFPILNLQNKSQWQFFLTIQAMSVHFPVIRIAVY